VAFVVVLDTCVLFPAHLRDTLLRLAEIELFVPVWSAHIIAELERNLVEYRVAPPAVARLTRLMAETFPDASITAYEDLIPSMTCHEKDRHVLAAAVRSKAAAMVTFNLRDFPVKSTEPYEIDAVDPDDFLLDLLDLAPRAVLDELARQAAANRRHPRTVAALLDALSKSGVPRFVGEVRRRG
jgi:predicted nucleic acid-binding protein